MDGDDGCTWCQWTIHFKMVNMVKFMLSVFLCSVAQLCLTLCDPCSWPRPPGSSVHGIFQARMLQWVAISSSRGSSLPRDRSRVSCIAGRFFTTWAPGMGRGRAGHGRGWYQRWRIFLTHENVCEIHISVSIKAGVLATAKPLHIYVSSLDAFLL